MAFHNVLNNSASTLGAAVAIGDLTINVVADVFPMMPFYMTIGSTPATYEIVEVTAKTGLVFTVGRGKDGTTAKAFLIGDAVQLFMVAGLLSELQSVVQGVEPAGQIAYFAMITPPAGWLKTNGALVSRVTYDKLFAAIGTLYGVGDGTTTFGLPDVRGEFIRGYDDGAGIDTGRVFGSYQADDIKSHKHPSVESAGYKVYGGSSGPIAGTGFATDLNTLNTGLTGITENRVKNIAFSICIKY